jgi:hypothetical protein
MGKFGKPRLTADWPAQLSGAPVVFSPCIAGLPPDLAVDLAILPIHDANRRLVEALPAAPRPCAPDYAGLCLSDPFMRIDDLLARLRAAGIGGVANFPTVAPMLAGEDADQFTLLYRRELQGLDRAAAAGFATLRIGPDGDATGQGVVWSDLRVV